MAQSVSKVGSDTFSGYLERGTLFPQSLIGCVHCQEVEPDHDREPETKPSVEGNGAQRRKNEN